MPGVDFPLYLVTARDQTCGRPLVPLLKQAFAAGVRAVQVREKDLETPALLSLATDVLACARAQGVRVLINDRVDVALALGAEGVHLRANSLPVAVTRKILGPTRLLGVSTHTAEEAIRAEADGADFVVLGPVYETPSKTIFGAPLGLGVLEDAASRCRVPILAIGGITIPRVREVRRAGAFGVAVISSILSAPDIEGATRALVEALNGAW